MRIIDAIRGWFGRKPTTPTPHKPTAPGVPPASDWERRLLTLHNEARATRMAGPLVAHEKARTAAQRYADWLAATRVLPRDHAGPGGNTVADRLGDTGYAFGRVGENIARGQQTPDDVFHSWMNSTGHYQNIVNGKYAHWGAGRAVDDQGRVYWVCVFAAPYGDLAALPSVLPHLPPPLDGGSPCYE